VSTAVRRAPLQLAGLAGLAALLLLLVFFSLTQGSRDVAVGDAVRALLSMQGDGSMDDTVTLQLRVPRTILGLLAGAALGLAGAILQGVTRNSLADPGIMGINAGAALFVVIAISVLGITSIGGYLWFGLAGALVATVLVYTIASFGREGATPVKLALAGVAVTAGLTSVTSAIVVTNIEALDQIRFWQVGSLAGRYAPVVEGAAPFLVLGILLALASGRTLNGLALGEDLARGLGINVRRARWLAFGIVTLLAGAATAACGPIVFVGLVIPHLARFLAGPDYRWILPYSLLLGPTVLLLADLVGRLVAQPGEVQVGVVLGVLGAPVFVGVVRYGRLAEL
jgi:iron complex transport system permease protein